VSRGTVVRSGAAPLLAGALLALALAGCAAPRAEDLIRERLMAIRAAILAERVEGIFEFGTPDWAFVAPDGTRFDRTSYRARTEQLFARIGIESLDTAVESVRVRDGRAEVRLVQTMVRTETGADGRAARVRVRYAEVQDWVDTPGRGWLVAQVRVLSPSREELPAN
jgi:ketosteroid isomerase-like protein